ncbi:hypothetical protein P154DRAFT_525371 [Amniculicola lignicola CBS 123094]|uniref:Uncharacterized protein n=1 Tax=Amniculicola lignicola CBS 123094 TaxID=1392246 RepID=A0A6A5W5S1_9PLEO|nr:hypothetical protein P154DRAFT_525371 [Amniculicola lignicola CBS 123094]
MGGKPPYLPAEVISDILESCASKTTLAVAARCSRQWYDIAMPHLWHRIDVHNPVCEDSNEPYLKWLAALFLSKPAIAAHVRHFSVRPAFEDDPAWEEYGEFADIRKDRIAARLKGIQEAVASFGYSDEERAPWLEEDFCGDTFLTMLLPTMPNLVSLDLMGPQYAECVERMLWCKRGSAFTNLKSVFWTYEPFHCMPDGAIIIPAIFVLPSIERIYLHKARGGGSREYGEEVDERLAKVSPRTTTCTHLELRDCRFYPGDVQTLILIPKALRSFIYEIGRPQLYSRTFSFPMIRQGLEHHKNTLEELCLDYCHGGFEGPESDMSDDSSPMTPLKTFTRLRRLKIAPLFILGRDLPHKNEQAADQSLCILNFLPGSIQQLQLTHCQEPENLRILLDVLTNILMNKTTHVPSLHRIVVEIESDLVEKLDFAMVLRLAKSVGTKIVLMNIKDHSGAYEVERKWGFGEDIEWRKCYENHRPLYRVMHA